MSIISKTRRPLKAVEVDFDWIQKPICPCEVLPSGSPGLLLLNHTVYMITVLGELPDNGPPIIRGYRMTKSDGTVYDVSSDTWTCDCPDATYRSHRPGCNGRGSNCKHATGLRKALAFIGLEDDPDAVPAISEPCPF